MGSRSDKLQVQFMMNSSSLILLLIVPDGLKKRIKSKTHQEVLKLLYMIIVVEFAMGLKSFPLKKLTSPIIKMRDYILIRVSHRRNGTGL